MTTAAPAPLIVHVIFRFGVGGLENGIVNLVNRMPARRWRHAIVALADVSSEFAQRIARPDIRCIALGKRPGHLVWDYPRLYRLFRELDPAIVHTRNLAALEAVVPAWAAGAPVRIHGEHGWDMRDPVGRSRRYRHVRRFYRPFVNRYVALSHHLEDYLEQQVGIAPEKISQIYNGVDTDRFCPSREGRSAIPERRGRQCSRHSAWGGAACRAGRPCSNCSRSVAARPQPEAGRGCCSRRSWIGPMLTTLGQEAGRTKSPVPFSMPTETPGRPWTLR